MNGRILVPAKYNLHITISVDTVTGQSEYKCSQPVHSLLLAGIFTQHAAEVVKNIIINSVHAQPKPKVETSEPTGGSNGA